MDRAPRWCVRSSHLAAEGSSTNNYGLYHAGDAIASVDSSQLSADGAVHHALYQTGGTVGMAVTQLSNDALRTGGTLTCFQVYTGAYASYSCP